MLEELTKRPLNLLGVPYGVELVALPDPEEINCDRWIDRAAGVVKLQTGTTETYAKRSLFGVIVRDAAGNLPPGHDVDWNQVETFSCAYYGMLRSNPAVLAFCAGWSDDLPEQAIVNGVPWDIHLADNCPGYDKNTFGLAVYRDQSIHLLRDVNQHLLRMVLLHELGHAVAESSALSLLDDEAFLRAFHVTLAAALRDNSDLCKYLFT